MEKRKAEEAKKLLKKGQEIAKTLSNSGLVYKECALPNKRVDYFRGEHFVEHMTKNLEKVNKIYEGDNETPDSRSVNSLAQLLMKDGLLIKLERVKEEKMYKWPRKLDYSHVFLNSYNFSESFI